MLTLTAVVGAFWATVGVIHCAGAKQDLAEASHLGQLAECVEMAETLAESKACRAEVEARWGRLPDGGRAHD